MSLRTRTAALVIATALMTALFATHSRADTDEPPVLDVDRACAARHAGEPETQYYSPRQDIAVCIKAEQYAYDDLKVLWPGLTATGKRMCTPAGNADAAERTYRWVLACTVGRLRGEENERNAKGPRPQFERW